MAGLVGGAFIIVLIALGVWAIISCIPPPSKICGTPGGPPITAPRIRLSDGRYLAYEEHGVSRQNATFKIIFIHAFATFRRDAVIANRVRPVMIQSLLFCYVYLYLKKHGIVKRQSSLLLNFT